MRFSLSTIFLAVAAFAEDAELRELGKKKSGGYAPIAAAPAHKTTPLQATKKLPTQAASFPMPVLGKGPIPTTKTGGTLRFLGKKKGGYNNWAAPAYAGPVPQAVFPLPEQGKKAAPIPAPVVKTVIPQPPQTVGKGKKQIQIAQPPKVKFEAAPVPIHKKGGQSHLSAKKLRFLGKKKGGRVAVAAPVKKAAAPTVAWGVPTQHKKAAPPPTKKGSSAATHSLGAYPATYA